jgi:predicted methyltransferase
MRLLPLAAVLLLATTTAHAATTTTPSLPPVLPPPDMNAPAEPDATLSTPIERALAGDWRSEKNRARDAYRHPRETLAFFGVDPAKQTLLEIWPGGGWYAEVLGPAFEFGGGQYVAIVPKPAPDSPDASERGGDKLRASFAARPDLYTRAQVREALDADPDLGPPASADVVLTFRNVHNWVMAGNEQAMFRAFFKVLKPGGTLGVVDHRAAPDQPPAEMKTSGYLPQDYVIALAQAAGFELVATSEINANPKDTKDYDKGVWTLPPTYTLGDKDRVKYAAIGESDRMTLKFRKPQ